VVQFARIEPGACDKRLHTPDQRKVPPFAGRWRARPQLDLIGAHAEWKVLVAVQAGKFIELPTVRESRVKARQPGDGLVRDGRRQGARGRMSYEKERQALSNEIARGKAIRHEGIKRKTVRRATPSSSLSQPRGVRSKNHGGKKESRKK